jgi:rubrerythrin
VLKTTSQLLSYHQSLEEEQAGYHTALADKYPEHAATFNKLAKDNMRHMDMAQRAYREGVTDAFEVGFLAEELDSGNYTLAEPSGDFSASVKTMISNEEKIITFCGDAASNSSKLLPNVPETFERLVKRKQRSIEKMKELV